MREQVGAACGVAAPVAFVSAWLAGGVLREDYDPLHDAISRLAAEGAPTRPLMTAGFVAFGLLAPVWARTLGGHLASPAVRRAVTTAGLATLAVAALPLTADGGTTQDTLHAVAAATGYVAMAATPLLAAPALRRAGRRRAAAASVGVAVVAAGALVGTVLIGDDGPLGSGGLQRLGLTAVDAWHVVMAVGVLVHGRRAERLPR